MRNKIVMIIAALAVMMAMTGIAAADPSRIDIKPGDDSNPLFHPLDGSTQSYPTKIFEMSVPGNRYIEIRASSGLTSARIYGNGVDITAASGSSASQTWIVPIGVTEQTFTLEVKTSGPGEVTILNNAGTSLFDSTVAIQDFGSGSNSFIPEFATVAIPIAAVLGLVFFFQQRKNKKE